MRFPKLLCGIGCLMLCAAAGSLAGQTQNPPPAGDPKDFVLPKKQTLKLDNGFSATLVSYGSLPKVSVRLVVRAGNLNEAENEVWLADLTGRLMKEGTQTRTSDQISEQAAGMGGSVDVGVGPDETAISCEVLSEFGQEVVGLIADVAKNPIFPESEIERLKRDMLRDLSIQKSQPGPLAMEKFLQVLYPDHPYGRAFSTPEMVKSFNVDRVRSFYQKNFGAARSHLYVVGRFDKPAVIKAIRTAFQDWGRGPDPFVEVPESRTERKIHIVDRPGAPQSSLIIGLPVVDPSDRDYIGLLVTDALLGGSFTSRITNNIRENKGYTYSPRSVVSTRYRNAYWAEIADVGTEVTGPAIGEILNEIDRLRKEPPPADELKGIQNYMAGIFVLRNASRYGIIGQLSFMNLNGLEDGYLSEFVQNVHSLHPADIQRLSKEYLKDENIVLVIVGDRKKILKEVLPFGPLEK